MAQVIRVLYPRLRKVEAEALAKSWLSGDEAMSEKPIVKSTGALIKEPR
jgi:hypothetical protein